jgi:hypothetical protein
MLESFLLAVSLVFAIGFMIIRIKYLSDRNPNSDLLIEVLNTCCSDEITDKPEKALDFK